MVSCRLCPQDFQQTETGICYPCFVSGLPMHFFGKWIFLVSREIQDRCNMRLQRGPKGRRMPIVGNLQIEFAFLRNPPVIREGYRFAHSAGYYKT